MKTKQMLIPFALGLGLALALGVLWLLSTVAHADATHTHYVAPTGADAGSCSNSANPCRTVQYAVAQAGDGDTVKIAAGTYTATASSVVSITKSITLSGSYAPPDWTTSDIDGNPTVLDGQEQRRVVAIAQGYTVTLEGLQIVNGKTADHGGGVKVVPGDPDLIPIVPLVIRNCAILSNTSEGEGGGAWVRHSILSLESSRIVSNTAGEEGGGVVAGGVTTMTYNLFQDNDGCKDYAFWGGGGAYVDSSEHGSYVAHNIFEGNSCRLHDGGGLYIYGTKESLVVTDNVFRSNTANGKGGGLYIRNSIYRYRTCTVTHNLFQDNIAALDDDGHGGGAYVGCSSWWTVFSHNQVLDNIATTGKPKDGRGGGAYIWGSGLISDNLVQGNWGATVQKSTGRGGGIYLTGDAFWVDGNRILENRATELPSALYAYGGGVYVGSGPVTMTNNIVAGNCYSAHCGASSNLYTGGGGIYVTGVAQFRPDWLRLTHNTIADNQSPAIENGASVVTMSHNILSGHSIDLEVTAESQFFTPTIAADYTLWYPAMNANDYGTLVTTTDDFTGTPDFVSTALDDYHIGSNSQAIDKGPGAGVATDIDGHPRPIGGGYDLGADEHVDVDLSTSTKSASPQHAGAGEVVTFTIVLRNSGTSDAPSTILSDTIPISATYVPSSVNASSGTPSDVGGIGWTGTVTAGQAVTITFQVTINEDTMIENTAVLTDTYGTVHYLTAWVNQKRVYLPLVVRN